MNTKTIKPFQIIGIAVRTTNENGQAGTDIGALWQEFMTTGVLDKIPNKISNDIYSIYTDYESDHTKPYTTILGCQVSDISDIPKGMVAKTFEGGNYIEFTAKGNLQEGAVYQEWSKIWAIDLARKYTADFEVYGEKAQNPNDAEVAIFIAVG